MLDWKTVWQAELTKILGWYIAYKQQSRYFFLQLLGCFFLVNALCYWLAVYTAFPELLNDINRTFKIQFIVALMGGLFDSCSFFITIWLIQKASRALRVTHFAAILSVDLIIAAIATAWVLFAVLFGTWLIGLQEQYANQTPVPEVTAVTETLATTEKHVADADSNEKLVPEIPATAKSSVPSVETATVETSTAEVASTTAATARTQPVASGQNIQPKSHNNNLATQTRKTKPTSTQQPVNVAATTTNISRQDFYHNIMISAVMNPLQNARYFLFGLIMGFSTLLPTLFHIVMAFRTLIQANDSLYLENYQRYIKESFLKEELVKKGHLDPSSNSRRP